MESIASMTVDIKHFESQLESITLQNNLEDIIKVIKEFQEKNFNKKVKGRSKKSKNKLQDDQDLNILIQGIIQRQLKKYIDVIESNLKKYWYTDMESKLYNFLSDLRINWDFFEPYFKVDDSVDILENSIHEYILDLKKQRSQIEIDELMDKISNSFEYWPTQKAQRCLELAKFLEQEKEIEQSLVEIQKTLIKYNIENSLESGNLTTLEKKFPLLLDEEKNKILLPLLKEKITVINKQENNIKLNEYLDKLEETIIRGGVWDQSIEEMIFPLLYKIDMEDISNIFRRLLALIKMYYTKDEANNSIHTLYPELKLEDKLATIDVTYEGVWTLNILFKGNWIPGYRLKDITELTKVEFVQEGEWKNRKFKCFSWSLTGLIPFGTILKLTNKKEIIYSIITNQNTSHIRDIDLTDIDERIIKNLYENDKKDHQSFINYKIDDKFVQFLDTLIQNDPLFIKIMLKMISIDKNRVTKLTNIEYYSFQKNGAEYKSKLDKIKDEKFILYIDRLLAK